MPFVLDLSPGGASKPSSADIAGASIQPALFYDLANGDGNGETLLQADRQVYNGVLHPVSRGSWICCFRAYCHSCTTALRDLGPPELVLYDACSFAPYQMPSKKPTPTWLKQKEVAVTRAYSTATTSTTVRSDVV